MNNTQYINEINKIIKKFIFESRKFVQYSCFPYGLHDLLIIKEKNTKLVYDFEYFSFTKSTKSLISIKSLLDESQNEDAMILLRSVFENYLSTRYFQEHPDRIDDFISNPVQIALGHYIVNEGGMIVNRDKVQVGKQSHGPSTYKLGKDKTYFTRFYDILSRYAHCNYGIIDHYIDMPTYTYSKENNPLLIRIFVIFIFTKLFESVVTVEGEDHKDERSEQSCYQLVKDSLSLQNELFSYLIVYFKSNNEHEYLRFQNKHMKELLKSMKKSLHEPLGSIDKTFLT
ncbi:DUF5677 domain-containing protein [Anaerobacillus sp. 1_MG-2023]|uniref:DUF5677 domain-containing protein n=1 Tax=Anaerobacillus sp. 1_MG-2023 TaxID=3062655 RepID=UPI0026E3273A|nr:DUF5677 domain-containing protein [Anaerobacillus sp. 1_MG-2023]MDO6657372.1 DUF5677 domain-containing protein [Anaerobacillus sp. 1_MG-2023]